MCELGIRGSVNIKGLPFGDTDGNQTEPKLLVLGEMMMEIKNDKQLV